MAVTSHRDMPKQRKVTALYARVSSADGSQTTKNQLRALRELAERAGWNVLEYTDHQSGADETRPQYQAMLAAARRYELERIVVWKYDRFARSTVQLILQLEEFGRLGVNFVSITENIDTATPAGKFMFTMMAGFAEFERSIGLERTRAGVDRAKSEGKTCHRPRKLVLDAKKAHEARQAGATWAQLEARLGHGRRTIARRISEYLERTPHQ